MEYKYEFIRTSHNSGSEYIETLVDLLSTYNIIDYTMDINYGFLNFNKYIKSISFENEKDYEIFISKIDEKLYKEYLKDNISETNKDLIQEILSFNENKIDAFIQNGNLINNYKINKFKLPFTDNDNDIILISSEKKSLFLEVESKNSLNITKAYILKNNQDWLNRIINSSSNKKEGYDLALLYNIGTVKYGKEEGDIYKITNNEVNSLLNGLIIKKMDIKEEMLDDFKKGL